MGYTYVMSDIHGMAHLLKQMLEKIRFSDEDQLYILGDMIDRGPDPAGVIDLVSQSRNITALRGNHEDSFAEWYENVEDKVENRYYYNTYDVLTGSAETMVKIPRFVSRFVRIRSSISISVENRKILYTGTPVSSSRSRLGRILVVLLKRR